MPGFVQIAKAYILFIEIRTRRGFKRSFLVGLWYLISALLVIVVFKQNQKMLMVAYAWFRDIDDVVDGENHLPAGENVYSYLDRKRAVISQGMISSKEDLLFECFVNFFDKKGVDMRGDSLDLISAMEWDCIRRGHFVKREELEANMAMGDKSVLMLIIRASTGDFTACDELAPYWGIFSKIDSLIDIEDDVRRGIINIPLEDAIIYGFRLEDIVSGDLRSVKRFNEWYSAEVKKSLDGIQKVNEILKKRSDFQALNLVLRVINVKPQSFCLKGSPSFYL